MMPGDSVDPEVAKLEAQIQRLQSQRKGYKGPVSGSKTPSQAGTARSVTGSVAEEEVEEVEEGEEGEGDGAEDKKVEFPPV